MSIDRTKLDPNWLTDAVREFDKEMKDRPPYTGYSPFKKQPQRCTEMVNACAWCFIGETDRCSKVRRQSE